MMKLEIERPAREPSERRQSCERDTLDAAYRALREVNENVVGLEILPPPETAIDLRKKAQSLAKLALDRGDLTSDSPEGPLHKEFSGWGQPIKDAPGIARELVAADVLDFLASLLGSGDRLVHREEKKT